MIKKTPTDFRVDEVLGGDLTALVATSGPYALYRMTKSSLATPEAIGQISRELKVPARAFAYAGLKDKHAYTTQHITLKMEEAAAVGEAGAPEVHKATHWSLERLGFVPRSITAADIQNNRFRINVRNLTKEASNDIEEAVQLLKTPDSTSEKITLRVINYFGDQRFGSARHGQGFIGRHLCKEDFEGALKLAIATESRKDRMEDKSFKRIVRSMWGQWKAMLPKLRPCPDRKAIERLVNSGGDFRAAFCALPYLLQQLSVYAYQSHLWNATARKLVERVCVPLGQVLIAEDDFGDMLFPAAAATPPEFFDLDLPLLAKKTELKEPWKQDAEEVLKAEGLEVGELHINGVRRPFFGEESRQLIFRAEEFVTAPPVKDELAKDPKRLKRTVSFLLPRGSYATVVLRALGQ
jgi:tRNA pseudouridine13 synthase